MTDAAKELRNVIAFAAADGKLGGQERAFIDDLRRRRGIDDQQFEQLLAEAQSGAKTLSLSRDPDEARRAMDVLVATAAADGMVSHQERQLLRRIAKHLGMDDTTVAQVIDEALAANTVDESHVEAMLEDIYAHFNGWDAAAREAKLGELAAFGHQAVLPLLRMLESYRTPDGAGDGLELKRLVAERLGELGDDRAAYYLIQIINIGRQDDEVTNAALRHTAAGALGKITGEEFTPDDAGVEAVRTWWVTGGPKRDQYDKLAL